MKQNKNYINRFLGTCLSSFTRYYS